MKCPHCGGSIIEDPGCYPHGPEKKCMSCGRRIESGQKETRVMEIEKKTCSKCLKELPMTAEFFNKNANKKDGLEGKCKNCRKKYFEDYRAGKRIRGESKKVPAPREPKPKKIIKPKTGTDGSLTKATPAEILIALRKGMAAEIVAMINEKYDL